MKLSLLKIKFKMKHPFLGILLLSICISCSKKSPATTAPQYDFVIAFGSCNNQDIENKMWAEIEKHKPDVWIWGGDIIYGDTEDMQVMWAKYEKLKNQPDYQRFEKNTDILATWDDHDYGVNDGGAEFAQKEASQQLFLDFLDVSSTSPRRSRDGVYHSVDYPTESGNSIKIILLDTRYFRTELTKSEDPDKRYRPNEHSDGTILGEAQWQWLEDELRQSDAQFNIIVTSIQLLSGEHGWETWANMPNEVERLEGLLIDSGVKNAIVLSGDRHISDFSMKSIEGLAYPLIDFTSSGMTHSSTHNLGEPNSYRIGSLVNQKSFGLLKFNISNNSVLMEMRGETNELQQNQLQNY